MSITLSVGATTVTLHPDLYWSDEHDWHPVAQSVERSLTGALVVDVGTMTAGRSITLRPEADNSGWMPLAAVQQLAAWAATPAITMTLTLRGVPLQVTWRHHDAPALSAVPVLHRSDTDAADYYLTTLKLMTLT